MTKFKYAFDDNKRYHTWNYYLRNTFGEKVFKVSLNGGFTCPNLDGKVSRGGCTYCSNSGSGDFAGNPASPLSEQFNEIKAMMHKKWPNAKYIAYFQAYTNTYAPLNVLKDKFEEALSFENVIGLSISTRPDCLEDDILKYLDSVNKRCDLWIELGLQTINNSTADYIRRGYPLSVYDEAVSNLLSIGIAPVVHMIIGLPHETISDYIATARYIADSGASGIKISLLHILKDTDLYDDYCKGLFKALTMDEYLAAIGAILPVLPKNMVIHRLTGDGPKNILAAPLWTADKKRVLNTLSHYLKENMIYQGNDL